MRTTNEDVAKRFVRGDTGHTGGGAVSSRGERLYSYNACIAYFDGGVMYVNDGWDGYSPTTSKHMTYLFRHLTSFGKAWTPTGEGDGRGKSRWTTHEFARTDGEVEVTGTQQGDA